MVLVGGFRRGRSPLHGLVRGLFIQLPLGARSAPGREDQPPPWRAGGGAGGDKGSSLCLNSWTLEEGREGALVQPECPYVPTLSAHTVGSGYFFTDEETQALGGGRTFPRRHKRCQA